MRTLGILFYTVILTLIGLGLIFLALGLSFEGFQTFSTAYVNTIFTYLETNIYARITIFLAGLLLILLTVSFAQLIIGRFQREKNIAFNTASGEVTIALSAIEDLIRRLVNIIPEIKELRPDVRVTKKGSLIVDLRVVLKSEANLPELTMRLQDITRAKIQDVLGIEEQIIIKIHVAKIISDEEKDRRRKETEGEHSAIPFGRYSKM
ncbi:MAG: alkaline shock response membrane anchor protein AmaP [Candidatus Omnitrophica bacterium]|nr:alkaline shock response membrane anchor protein AmaP [Candidatus Omnitrophota bacterium]